jgi:hypothetical protein
VGVFEDARNALMHGRTLREYEAAHPTPDGEPHLVDKLYAIVRSALLLEYPEDVRKEFQGDERDTVIDLRQTMVAHVQTIVPSDADGNLDLGFPGFHIAQHSEDPPQSALPGGIFMTPDQYQRLKMLCREPNPEAKLVSRICRQTFQDKGRIVVVILSTDLERVKEAMRANERGGWQDLLREAFAENLQG